MLSSISNCSNNSSKRIIRNTHLLSRRRGCLHSFCNICKIYRSICRHFSTHRSCSLLFISYHLIGIPNGS
ncbi:MAG TPA: hypothetical protein [Caudoviricetes sp.]|nr:MAG TPA: hypothetical protein [Caudoviricetes sp.]